MIRDTSALRQAFASAFQAEKPAHLGVAVSGGGDSLALLHLAAEWGGREGVTVSAVTVDHGLRSASAQEAAFVGDVCGGLGVAHSVVTWGGWNGAGNLQDAARRARYALMADWAQERGIGAVVLGHTADDQAETFVMRLARAAGVDGLAGMAPQRTVHGIVWMRPLLQVRRADLRAFLRDRAQPWADDPSNDDTQFDRIKARRALEILASLGIDVDVLGNVTAQLGQARDALKMQTLAAARDIARVQAGDVVLNRAGLLRLPPEIRRRVLVNALNWVALAEYGPRRDAVAGVEAAINRRRGATLHGCAVLPDDTQLRITREYQAVREVMAAPGALWDRRWRLSGPDDKELHVQALGETGLSACPDWRDLGVPRASLLATPSLWRGTTLVAAPLAGMANGWRAEVAQGADSFFDHIISD